MLIIVRVGLGLSSDARAGGNSQRSLFSTSNGPPKAHAISSTVHPMQPLAVNITKVTQDDTRKQPYEYNGSRPLPPSQYNPYGYKGSDDFAERDVEYTVSRFRQCALRYGLTCIPGMSEPLLRATLIIIICVLPGTAPLEEQAAAASVPTSYYLIRV